MIYFCTNGLTNNELIAVETDIVGPTPSFLTFASGQSSGDRLCADMMIVDDPLPQNERDFFISIVNDIDPVLVESGLIVDHSPLTITIAVDSKDCK